MNNIEGQGGAEWRVFNCRVDMIETSSNTAADRHHKKINPAFLRSVCITIFLILVYRLGFKIQIPFLNEDLLNEFLKIQGIFDSQATGRYSIFSLGLMPYFSAFVLVEIFSLFLPFLNKFRSGDYEGRRKLKQIALILTLVLSMLQGFALTKAFVSVRIGNETSILCITNNFEYFIVMMTLTASVFFLILICELISKYGIGHGISLIVITDICGDFFHSLGRNASVLKELGPLVYAIILFVIGLLAWLTILLLTTKVSMGTLCDADNKPRRFFQFNFCPSGYIPITYATSIVMIPITILFYTESWRNIADAMNPGSFYYETSMLVCALFFSYLFAWLFLHPRRRIEKMMSRGWQFQTEESLSEKFLLKKLLIYNLPWTGFLCLLAITPHLLISGMNIPFYIGGTTIPIIVAISLDILDRYKFSNLEHANISKIAELHDVYDAAMIKNHLTHEGISCYMQGYYHRHLLYFFGPHIEMSLVVPDEDQEAARKIIRNDYDGLGLY